MRRKEIPLIAHPNIPTPEQERAFAPQTAEVFETFRKGWDAFFKEFPEENRPATMILEGRKINVPTPESIAALEKYTKLLQYLPMSGLERDLKTLTEQFNQYLKELDETSYCVGFNCGKSTQWVNSLMLEHLDILPTSWFSLSSCQGTVEIDKPEIGYDARNVKQNTVLLADDAAYSGGQLADNVQKLANHPSAKSMNVVILVPYMSKRSLSYVNVYQDSFKSFKILTTDTKIRPIAIDERFNSRTPEDLTFEEIEKLEGLEFYYGRGGFGSVGQTYAYATWRYPDGASFPQNFGRFFYPIKIEQAGKPAEWHLRTINWIPKKGGIPRPYAWSAE